jgi:hypothetical protein
MLPQLDTADRQRAGDSLNHMQYVSVKIFEQSGAELHGGNAIAVFHRWIQKGGLPEMAIDVADYAHIPAGPGVILVCREASYSLDNHDGRLGLLYQRKTDDGASDQASLNWAYDSAVTACRRLEGEPEFKSHKFDEREFAITWNDRALYPNTDESWQRVRPSVVTFLDALFGAGGYKLTRTGQDRRERLSAEVRAVAARPEVRQ